MSGSAIKVKVRVLTPEGMVLESQGVLHLRQGMGVKRVQGKQDRPGPDSGRSAVGDAVSNRPA